MSLISFLKYSPQVRERFKIEFFIPPLDSKRELLAPSLSQNHSLVGGAFDYLLRFYIERLNPKAHTRKWIAEEVMEDPAYGKFSKLLTNAKSNYQQYLSNGEINDKLLKTTIHLAQLDVLYRSADDSYYFKVGIIDRKDMLDLRKLISLVQPKMFKAKKACSLNPTFGRASTLVGGADCDVVIDDAIIEIKTTKDFQIKRDYFNQLIGYYTLSRIGGISGLPKAHVIRKLGIYFPRHGHLWMFNINTAIDEKRFSIFAAWFKTQARKNF